MKYFLILCVCMSMTRSVSAQSSSFLPFIEKLDQVTFQTQANGERLLERIYQGETLYGHHVTFIHETLSDFVVQFSESLTYYEKLEKRYRMSSQHKEVFLKLTALQISLLQNYLNVYQTYFKQKKMRRIVQNQIETLNFDISSLEEFGKKVLSPDFRTSLRGKLGRYKELKESRQEVQNLLPYQRNIEQRKLWSYFLKNGDLDSLNGPLELKDRLGDQTNEMIGDVTSGLSWAYGKVAGNIKWRQGYLKNESSIHQDIKSKLEPLDILFEKRAFVFTDYSIPGHWGHASIWLGSEEDLKELGIWDHPVVQPFQERISKGQSIYEVRRWGLQFNDLKTFLNLDEFASVRVKGLNERPVDEIVKIYEFLFDQIGKDYDFLFDAMTTDKVTCTEIIAFSFGPINWPMEYILGRYAITPNNIAELAMYGNSPTELVTYYVGNEDGGREYGIQKFAHEMNFRLNEKKSTSGAAFFEEHSRKCSKRRYRQNGRGGIRFQNRCRDQFVHRSYKGSDKTFYKIE